MKGIHKTVLIVQEHDDLRVATAELLESMGIRVFKAAGAATARSIFRRRREDIDLLVVDELSAGHDGFELAESLRSQKPELAVLVLSMEGGQRPPFCGGEICFLRKPFTAPELERQVRRALDRAGCLAPCAASRYRRPWTCTVMLA